MEFLPALCSLSSLPSQLSSSAIGPPLALEHWDFTYSFIQLSLGSTSIPTLPNFSSLVKASPKSKNRTSLWVAHETTMSKFQTQLFILLH
jgi:hypothetical protein